ncbi:MAG: hypothetical protein HN337_06355 [Deltaproteobacteria bacterium]|jgi:hypothetical protein|nr:hypothetical protein [Deltaproteobacteria bacterium]
MSDVNAAQTAALQQQQAQQAQKAGYRADAATYQSFVGRVTSTLAALGNFVVNLGGDETLRTPDKFVAFGEPAKPAKKEKVDGGGVKVEGATKREEALSILKEKLDVDDLEDIEAIDIPKTVATEIIRLSESEDTPISEYEDALQEIKDSMDAKEDAGVEKPNPHKEKEIVEKGDTPEVQEDSAGVDTETE